MKECAGHDRKGPGRRVQFAEKAIAAMPAGGLSAHAEISGKSLRGAFRRCRRRNVCHLDVSFGQGSPSMRAAPLDGKHATLTVSVHNNALPWTRTPSSEAARGHSRAGGAGENGPAHVRLLPCPLDSKSLVTPESVSDPCVWGRKSWASTSKKQMPPTVWPVQRVETRDLEEERTGDNSRTKCPRTL